MFLGIATGIWYAIVFLLIGIGVVLYAIFGAGWTISLWVFQHPENCQCDACVKKRMREWAQENAEDIKNLNDRRQPKDPHDIDSPNPPKTRGYDPNLGGWWIDDKTKEPMGGTWLSTVELDEGMYVYGADRTKLFHVDHVHAREYGFVVELSNTISHKKSWVRIGTDAAHHPIWLVRASRPRREQ